MCDPQKRAEEASGPTDMGRHGWSPGGSPLTWTGRPVSSAEWPKLSTWEKHGPDDRLWCGCCGAWVEAETGLAHAEKIQAEWLVAREASATPAAEPN